MAILTVTNLTAAPLLIQELYTSVPANGVLTTSRFQSDLTQMAGLQAAIAAGKATATVTYTSDELAAGIGGGGDEPLAYPKLVASANVSANGTLYSSPIGFASAQKIGTGDYKVVLLVPIPEDKRTIQVSASGGAAEFVYCDDVNSSVVTDIFVHVRSVPNGTPVDGRFAISVFQNAK